MALCARASGYRAAACLALCGGGHIRRRTTMRASKPSPVDAPGIVWPSCTTRPLARHSRAGNPPRVEQHKWTARWAGSLCLPAPSRQRLRERPCGLLSRAAPAPIVAWSGSQRLACAEVCMPAPAPATVAAHRTNTMTHCVSVRYRLRRLVGQPKRNARPNDLGFGHRALVAWALAPPTPSARATSLRSEPGVGRMCTRPAPRRTVVNGPVAPDP